jgi:DNA-binding transcriptional MerR regulator
VTAPATAAKSSTPLPPVGRPGPRRAPNQAGPSGRIDDPGLRIGDVAARAKVSPRTLRYYEELGLLVPSGRTAGGERRYQAEDVAQLERIIELKDLLGMNLEEIRGLLSSRARLDELRAAYRAHKNSSTPAANKKRRAILEEALALETSLVERMDAKLARMAAFRAEAQAGAERCVELLRQLHMSSSSTAGQAGSSSAVPGPKAPRSAP